MTVTSKAFKLKGNSKKGATPVAPILLLFVPLALAGCGNDGESSQNTSVTPACTTTPEAVYDVLFEDPFLPGCPDSSGSGAFGSWKVDAHGLPAYRYTLNHQEDPRAAYVRSWGESRDHWHQLGNDAISATTHNEGYIQLWDWTRGGKCVNRYQPSRKNFSGDFRFLKSGEHVWNAAPALVPELG